MRPGAVLPFLLLSLVTTLMPSEPASAAPPRAAPPLPRVHLRAGLSGIDVAEFALERRALLERLAARAGIGQAAAGLPAYELFADLVQKGNETGGTRPVDPPRADGTIRRLARTECSAREGEAEALWLLRGAWNIHPAPVWTMGLAGLEAGLLYGRPPAELAAALAAAGLAPTLHELLESPRDVGQYPTLLAPAATTLTRLILERHGTRGLRQAVRATAVAGRRAAALARALGVGLAELEESYTRALAGEPPSGPGAPRGGPAFRPVAARPAVGRLAAKEFQRGVCYAHTVSLEAGYASPRSGRALGELAALGVNWISVTPFGYVRQGDPRISASSAFGPEAETDESLAEVMRAARARGLSVMMKPHLWSHDFVGRLSMGKPSAWTAFFRNYARFLAHHAILARSCGARALCIGNELIEATRDRDAEWRTLIAVVRRLFDGPLTYGAHWDEEVGRIGFWQDLDWVGVSLYAPLVREPGAERADLLREARRQAERLEGVARRAGRPLVLVEVGFPSHSTAAMEPWGDPESGPADPRAQAEAFEAITLAFRGRQSLAGIYWWKWFSDDAPSAGDRSHRFAGKPAQEVVRRYFTPAAGAGTLSE
jgi:hypothetical protein